MPIHCEYYDQIFLWKHRCTRNETVATIVLRFWFTNVSLNAALVYVVWCHHSSPLYMVWCHLCVSCLGSLVSVFVVWCHWGRGVLQSLTSDFNGDVLLFWSRLVSVSMVWCHMVKYIEFRGGRGGGPWVLSGQGQWGLFPRPGLAAIHTTDNHCHWEAAYYTHSRLN